MLFEESPLYVEVIIPVPLPGTFTYRVPRELQVQAQVGQRVIVPFGKSRLHTGIIRALKKKPPEGIRTRYLMDVLDAQAFISESTLQFWEWLAAYYMCHVGEVMGAALPAGLKISSQSKIQLNPQIESEEIEQYAGEERLILDTLKESASLSLEDVGQLTGRKQPLRLVQRLVQKGLLFLYEEARERFTPKKERRIYPSPQVPDQETASLTLPSLQRAKKQEALFLRFWQLWPKHPGGVPRQDLLTPKEGKAIGGSILKALTEKGFLEEKELVVSRFQEIQSTFEVEIKKEITLSQAQEKAAEEVLLQWENKLAVLLHGITGSGKTEVYIWLIRQVLESGGQALMLIPEIALTTQLVQRLRLIFGERFGVYHSNFSANERAEIWRGVAEGKFAFVVGVRSSIFLPFKDLGLIIVDEEHEPSYKQYDPAPRYNARDVSLVLAQQQGAKVLLGSATPAFETYYLAKQDAYGYVSLNQRFADIALPEVDFIDLHEAKKTKAMKGNFTEETLEALREVLRKNEQAILFLNRRGYAPYLRCAVCEEVPQCPSCNVSLTLHLNEREVRCHYCGHQEKQPQVCPSCGSPKLEIQGFGTERIEDELAVHLPEARILRMDRDTTRKKDDYRRIISAFENHEADFLVGTQMVSKGLDFARVSLVLVFDIDRMLHFPDFRAHERGFQLITQVAGRAGRRNTQGKVLIQTHKPQDELLQLIAQNAYETFIEKELLEREDFNYPPFTRNIRLVIRHEDYHIAKEVADKLAARLQPHLGWRVVGPEAPLIDRIRNRYIQHILLKLERNRKDFGGLKQFLFQEIEILQNQQAFRKVLIHADVDPV